MTKPTSSCLRPVFFSLALGGMFLPACGGLDTLTSNAVSSDRSLKPLTGSGGVLLVPIALKGSYGANCKLHKGELWDLNLNDTMDTSLGVALNDTMANCPLTLTTIVVQAGASLEDHAVSPPIVLGTGYASSPSVANPPGPDSLSFFTNARFSGLAGSVYTNNFVISMVYSDDALSCQETAPPAIYAKVSAATVSTVQPPNYVMGFDSLQLVVDANKVVQNSSSGNVSLTLPASSPQPGEEWKIFTGTSPTYSFAEIDNMYKTSVPSATGNITGSMPIYFQWASFELAGSTLPKSRTLIVKHTAGGGVYSYSLYQILFPGPLA